MGQLVEVLEVEVEEVGSDGPLLGASIDGPAAGRRVAARALEIGGWALGTTGVPAQAEVHVGESVIARAPIRQPRPDIATAFPQVPGAERSGFEIAVDAGLLTAEAELEIRARIGSSAVPIGRLRLRRCWRGEIHLDPPAPVTVVVVWSGEGQDLDRTLHGLEDLRHPFTEVLVVHPPSSPPPSLAAWEERGVRAVAPARPGSAALRNEAIRRSNGELILFAEAGTILVADAVANGVESLVEKPEAAAVLDGGEGGEVIAALYRRSAFEELRGFDEDAGDSCDLELANRARGYEALFAPGSLAEGGG